MKTITIEGQLRTELGKGSHPPASLSGNSAWCNLRGCHRKLIFLLRLWLLKPLVYTPDFQFAEIKVDGKTYRCILKDLQFDKVTDKLIHVDLLELVEDKKVIATIPLKFAGSSCRCKRRW